MGAEGGRAGRACPLDDRRRLNSSDPGFRGARHGPAAAAAAAAAARSAGTAGGLQALAAPRKRTSDG